MEMTAETRSALATGFRRNFADGLGKYKPLWQRIATEVTSTGTKNTYPWLGDMPGLKEWIGERQVKKFGTHDYTIKNRKFEQTVAVDVDAVEDDEFGVYAPMFIGLGEAAAMWPDELVFEAVRGAWSQKGYDNQYFFDSDHPTYDAQGNENGSVSNLQAGAGEPWMLLNTKRSLKPFIFQPRIKPDKLIRRDKETDDNVFNEDELRYGSKARGNAGYGFWQMGFGSKATLNTANFKAARLAMRSLKDERGRVISNEPDLLVVGNGNADAAEELILKQRTTGGEDNTLFKAVDVLVCPYLY